jgi:hypothetical protein
MVMNQALVSSQHRLETGGNYAENFRENHFGSNGRPSLCFKGHINARAFETCFYCMHNVAGDLLVSKSCSLK